ncbi:bifunctional DNA primase/polymerase [Streptomyces sp. JJ36]|uniref:bifunctional DNA primase/polymerase n=1 Tax=Streptomyces sp. JJ36 TaxID=2736645 RepID=UPI001F48523A|nr:bifunctional DNA primase/polymerase [Streptomyces sp. JJ36]MCF6521858.1 bifunctional DNA primase/polymerase [Streptomyces sp. JJ36]
MERASRFPRWLRRRPRSGDASGAGGAQAREDLLRAAAEAGFPLAPAAHPEGYGCSCVRIGCPTPGRHPVSFAWQTQATTDPDQVARWAQGEPRANFVTATGRNHDVLDVPLEAGRAALDRLDAEGVVTGPVAVAESDRMFFFTATRGTPDDEDEWWPCELDCHPETMDEHPGLRWHCRGSYVLVPPATLPGEGPDTEVRWLRPPVPGETLPEPLTLLEALTDACAAHVGDAADHEPSAPWPAR